MDCYGEQQSNEERANCASEWAIVAKDGTPIKGEHRRGFERRQQKERDIWRRHQEMWTRKRDSRRHERMKRNRIDRAWKRTASQTRGSAATVALENYRIPKWLQVCSKSFCVHGVTRCVMYFWQPMRSPLRRDSFSSRPLLLNDTSQSWQASYISYASSKRIQTITMYTARSIQNHAL